MKLVSGDLIIGDCGICGFRNKGLITLVLCDNVTILVRNSVPNWRFLSQLELKIAICLVVIRLFHCSKHELTQITHVWSFDMNEW